MLSVQRPTPTTVLYTVSTRPPVTTYSARVKTVALLLLRLVAGLLAVLLLLLELDLAFSSSPGDRRGAGTLPWLFDAAGLLDASSPAASSSASSSVATAATAAERAAAWLVTHLARPGRVLLGAGVAWLVLRKSYVEESVLVIRGLGVQTSTSSSSYLWASSTRFIPTSAIQDLFIHEAFRDFQVRYYLSIVVEDEEDVVVVFPVSNSPRGIFLHSRFSRR